MDRAIGWSRTALLAGASGLLMAGAAQAQGAHPPKAADEAVATQRSLGKIVVSAGAEKVAIDTPQAVTALDQEDIDQTQATTMGDLLESIPGVSAVGGVSPLGQGFNIRGMGTGLADSDSRILMQVDGVTKFFEQYRMGAFFSEPELYKRVEVLRGPASSTLYGAGALAGVVNFTTKDASDFLTEGDRFAVRLRGGYETNSDGRFGSVIIAGKPGENLDLLAVITAREADHYESGDGTTVIPSNATSSSYLLKGKYYVGGNKGHNLWASYQNWLSDSTQIYDQAEAFGVTPVRRKVDDVTATLGYENDFGGSKVFDLKAQLSYADSTVEQRRVHRAVRVPAGPRHLERGVEERVHGLRDAHVREHSVTSHCAPRRRAVVERVERRCVRERPLTDTDGHVVLSFSEMAPARGDSVSTAGRCGWPTCSLRVAGRSWSSSFEGPAYRRVSSLCYPPYPVAAWAMGLCRSQVGRERREVLRRELRVLVVVWVEDARR